MQTDNTLHLNRNGLSEVHREPLLPLYAGSVHDLLTESGQKHGSKTAVACLHQGAALYASATGNINPSSPYLKWTYDELAHASHTLATALVNAGIRPGMRIAAFVSSGVEWVMFMRAALELNCPFAPLNPRTKLSSEYAKNIFEVIKPAAIFAENLETVQGLEECVPDLCDQLQVRLIANVDDRNDKATSWQVLDDFIDKVEENPSVDDLHIERKADDVILVLMTSGTTALPKGCPHTNKSVQFTTRAVAWVQCWDESRTSMCSYAQPSHVLGIMHCLAAMIHGMSLVHPSGFFEAGPALRALREENCTEAIGVSAMMHALTRHPEFKKSDTECLQFIALAGTVTKLDDIKVFLNDIGSTKACDVFGMTEVTIASAIRFSELTSSPREEAGSGYPVPGARLRIHDPDTGKMVARGTPGELHVASPGVLTAYWKTPSKSGNDDTFYTNAYGNWMKTGDQAVMKKDGEIEIVGRYKHMIIRGGENISPKSIETVLAEDFGITSDVIGIADEFAGEVPVAIIDDPKDKDTDQRSIKEAVTQKLGPVFTPDAIVKLADLGFDEFPLGPTGKVQKDVLQQRVTEYLETQREAQIINNTNDHQSSSQLSSAVIQIWTQLLGVNEGTIKGDTELTEWADSLIMNRFPPLVQRQLGRQIHVRDLPVHTTPSAQAEFLGQSKFLAEAQRRHPIPSHAGPPKLSDMPFLAGDEAGFDRIMTLSGETLQPLGLGWEDVQDVLPMYGMSRQFMKRRRPQSNNHRHAYFCPNSTVGDLRTAIKGALSRHDILRSMAIDYQTDNPLHVVVRPNETWFNQCITVLDESLDTADDLKSLKFHDPEFDFAAFPGPMLRFLVVPVKEKNGAGVVYMGQHSVFDGLSLPLFIEDLDKLVKNPQTSSLEEMVQYKAWITSLYNTSDSKAAQASVDWHTQRLHGLAEKSSSLFPTQRAPEWFKGAAIEWTNPDTGKPGGEREAVDSERPHQGEVGLSEYCKLPGMQELKRKYDIEAHTILRAALAVLNTRRTKTSSALFAQYQAGRDWPFLADWQKELMPPVMMIDGPMVEAVIVAIEVEPQTTVLNYLTGLRDQQKSLSKHEHAPFEDVVAALNSNSDDGNKDGDAMMEIWRRQIFNWLPSSGATKLERLQKVQQISRTDVGLLWNMMSLGPEEVQIMPSWDDAQLGTKEVEGLLQELMEIARGLAGSDSWEKTLSEI